MGADMHTAACGYKDSAAGRAYSATGRHEHVPHVASNDNAAFSSPAPQARSNNPALPRSSTFLALASRMKFIDRWALMYNHRSESLAEHTLDVAFITHYLCVLARTRYGRKLNEGSAVLQALYHDMSEIITGDMPTPVKYGNPQLRAAYKEIEESAAQTLVSCLPPDLRSSYSTYLTPRACGSVDVEESHSLKLQETDSYSYKLVKAADKLSALIKCIEERASGNTEFDLAYAGIYKQVEDLASEFPEVKDFMDECLPFMARPLDSLV